MIVDLRRVLEELIVSLGVAGLRALAGRQVLRAA